MTPNSKTMNYDEAYTIPTSGYTKAGYLLKGWSDSATATTVKYGLTASINNLATVDGTTITLYAVWGTQNYNITYTGGGTASPANPTTYDVTSLPISLTAPTRLGYKFDGWTGSLISTPTKTFTIPVGTTGDLTFTANWTPISYYILYKAPDATAGTTSSSTHKYDTAQNLTTNTFSKTGFSFAGWTTTNGGTTVQYLDKQNVVNLSSTDGATITLYAVWTANGYAQYTIEYYKGDAGTYTLSDTETQSGVIGTQVTAPNKSYEGYTENTTTPNRKVTGTVLADGTLVLKRYYDKNSIKVTFLVNNSLSSVSTGSKLVTTGQSYGVLPTPTAVDGYEFQGWYAEPSLAVKVDESTVVTQTTDHYLYGKWKKTKVTITYETTTIESTVTPKTQDLIIGSAYGSLPTPTSRTGYTFDGWYTDTGYTNKISASSIVTQTTDYTVYAKWKPIEYYITYENVFDASNPNPVKYTSSDFDIVLTSPVRNGYNFIGWYLDSGLTQRITKIATSDKKDLTIYAKWEVSQPTGKVIYYVKNSFENDPSTDANTFEHFEDAKRYCDQLFLTTPVVVWDANGAIVYDPSKTLFLKSDKYYIGDFKDVSLKEWETGDKYLFNINAGTTIAGLIANLKTNGTIKIYDKNYNEITDTTTLVGTGMHLVDTKGVESISLDIIVKGDVNGDGKLSITDLSTLNGYLTGKSTLSGIYLKAADMDLNGKVSITDLSSMNQALVSGI
ncbi:Listeria-Bacteroides repeat domain [compost metagenome]